MLYSQTAVYPQTNMLSFQRSFSVNPAALASGHPYAVDAFSKLCTIHFFEFRGIGPPSPDFGHAGDVYVDVNPQLHALYWRDRDVVRGFGAGQWKRWTALLLDNFPLYKFLVSHPWARNPETSDLYLWVDPSGVTWTSKDNLCASRVKMVQRNIATAVPGSVPNVEVLISEVLQRMVEGERPYVEQRQSPRGGPSSQEFRYPPTARPPSRLLPTQPHRGSGQYSSVQPPHDSFRFNPSSFPNQFGPPGPGGLGPPSNPYPHGNSNPHSQSMMTMQQPSERERAAHIEIYPGRGALEGMRRAQNAEIKSKQELKLKNRELSKMRKKEKDVIGMSYMYQKREQELAAGFSVVALAAARQRSSAELEQMRAAVQALQRQAAAAQEQTRIAVAQVRHSEEGNHSLSAIIYVLR
ncbi:hypothetical protein C8R44DRAFT_728734 [Mycena epipterygia]|nr:hypothetical protein C8R44DRAFT_728734 [Mycena epipterygia]